MSGVGYHADTHVEASPNELKQFEACFPLLYFAICYLGNNPRHNPIIMEIASYNIQHCPSFDGLDLWLQRKALCLCIERNGIAKTLEAIVSTFEHDANSEAYFRVELLWFVVMRLDLSNEDTEWVKTLYASHKY